MPKNSKIFQSIPKNSKKFQNIPKYSRYERLKYVSISVEKTQKVKKDFKKSEKTKSSKIFQRGCFMNENLVFSKCLFFPYLTQRSQIRLKRIRRTSEFQKGRLHWPRRHIEAATGLHSLSIIITKMSIFFTKMATIVL